MNCSQFQDIAELLVLGELDAAETEAAERHLAACDLCRAHAAAVKCQLRALEAALAPHKARPDFVERTMARVRAQVVPPKIADDRPESLRSRVLRYGALAAAAALFVMAGYGFLFRARSAWVESGSVALLGQPARNIKAGKVLSPGDVVATSDQGEATLALAGGRLRVTLRPKTIARITDPRSGTALQVLRGEAYCRGSAGENAPLVASPLANVAAGPGAFSLNVTPEPTLTSVSAGIIQPFRGVVTLAAHDGAARVLVPGQTSGPMPLQRGQVLTFSSERGRAIAAPVPIGRLRQLVEAEKRAVQARHGDLESKWERIVAGRTYDLPGESTQLSRLAGDLQDALTKTRALHAELERRLQLLDRVQAEGRETLPLLIRPIP